MRASASWPDTSSAFASAAVAAEVAASALAEASASALPRFIQKVTMATSEPLAAISAPQVRTSCMAASPLEDARDLFDRAPAEIGGDNDAGPGRDLSSDRIRGAEAHDFVPDHHLPDVDHHGERGERTDDRRPPAALLRDDDRGRLRARGDLGLDFLDGELVLRVRRCELRLVAGDDRRLVRGYKNEKRPAPRAGAKPTRSAG